MAELERFSNLTLLGDGNDTKNGDMAALRRAGGSKDGADAGDKDQVPSIRSDKFHAIIAN